MHKAKLKKIHLSLKSRLALSLFSTSSSLPLFPRLLYNNTELPTSRTVTSSGKVGCVKNKSCKHHEWTQNIANRQMDSKEIFEITIYTNPLWNRRYLQNIWHQLRDRGSKVILALQVKKMKLQNADGLFFGKVIVPEKCLFTGIPRCQQQSLHPRAGGHPDSTQTRYCWHEQDNLSSEQRMCSLQRKLVESHHIIYHESLWLLKHF